LISQQSAPPLPMPATAIRSSKLTQTKSDKILLDQRARAYGDGYRARICFKKDQTANPYINIGREDLRAQWRAGWSAADADRQYRSSCVTEMKATVFSKRAYLATLLRIEHDLTSLQPAAMYFGEVPERGLRSAIAAVRDAAIDARITPNKGKH